MKILIKVITLMLLAGVSIFSTGCEVLHEPGIVVRDKITVAGKHGTSEKTAKMITLNADIPGLSEVPTPYGPIKIAQVSGTNVRTVTDPKTGVVVTDQTTTLGGLNVSGPVAARGEADKSRAKEFWSGISGAIISWGLAAFGAGVAPGAGQALSNVSTAVVP